jgi:hypothetical protein
LKKSSRGICLACMGLEFLQPVIKTDPAMADATSRNRNRFLFIFKGFLFIDLLGIIYNDTK